MILAACGLGKHYGPEDFHAVTGVTLSLEAGEFVSIVGRSGSGKSTLLAMLGALTRPSIGTVTLDSTDIWSMGEDALAGFRARHIGFVFQFPSLLATLSAADNVALPALLSGTLGGDQAYARARALLADVGLADRLDSFPSMLSGGEQRRVVIARALINRPRLLLADEPTSDLDEDSEAEIVALLDTLRREQGFGLLVVSHNLDIARRADRSYEMSRGRLLPASVGQPPEARARSAEVDTGSARECATKQRLGDVSRPNVVGHGSMPQPRLRPAPPPRPVAAGQDIRLGTSFWPAVRLALFGGAVAFSLVLIVNSLVDRYQRWLVRERADRLAALETLALSNLRANVISIVSGGDGRYELGLELWNVAGDKPTYVMSPSLRAYVQIGRQWLEIPSRPIEQSAASVLKITGRQSYRYRFDAKPADYTQLLPHYMHVRFVYTMLISPSSTPGDDLFERTDSYYVHLKPFDADDSAIKRDVKFDGGPPLWIPMPPH